MIKFTRISSGLTFLIILLIINCCSSHPTANSNAKLARFNHPLNNSSTSEYDNLVAHNLENRTNSAGEEQFPATIFTDDQSTISSADELNESDTSDPAELSVSTYINYLELNIQQ